MSVPWKHVILLSADALRADHLSCYGYQRETSPVIDDLASDSFQFTNAYSASSHTREAVPALLTGEYPDVALDSSYRLDTDTIASMLSAHGFATAGFHSNPYVSRAYGYDRGFDTFDDDLHFGKHRLMALAQRAVDKFRNRHYARAEEINERSIEWIDSLGDDQPFFLWNHYMDTHGPYEPPGEHKTAYRDTTVSDREAQSLYQRAIKRPGSITEEERALLIDLYDAEIRYNDLRLGEFLQSLRDRGLLEQSLLIFTADHGDAFGEHGYFEHPRYLHEEITHVPLLVRPPGGADGEVVETPVSTLDIVSTIMRDSDTGQAAAGSDRFVLDAFDSLPEDRQVFLQARGEGKDNQVRRYAVQARTGSCFCERDFSTGAIEFTDCTDPSLRASLRSHVESRSQDARRHERSEDEETDVDEEIERRLSALGYKE